MSRQLHHHTDDLREVLLKLPATGEKGFEGLLAAVFTEVSGVPFRLAGSGSQFGLDGKAAYEGDGVCFEGKRYDKGIPRTEVLSKIAELSIHNDGDVDLWVLGATVAVRTQLADDVREFGEKHGIATLILDWNRIGLPPLAVALAMAGPATAGFLSQYAKSGGHVAKAKAALKAIAADNNFETHASRIRALLEDPASGAGLARRVNTNWLGEAFSNQRRARRFLGQPLSPGDISARGATLRSALVNQITPLLTGKPDGKLAVILGGEGYGKSWVVAQTWLTIADKPLTIFFTADDFDQSSAASDLTELLIDKIIAQTDGRRSEAARNRWRRWLEQWRKGGTPGSPRLVVIIDGLNQRPRLDWGRLVDALASELDRIGGRLIITVRTAFYNSDVRHRLFAPTIRLEVPEWTDAERDAILAANDIHGAGLQSAVAASLRNPRLLGIALELIGKSQIREMEELGISRLLFEHMRLHEREAPSPRPASEFARKLRDHAGQVISRLSAQRLDDLRVFENNLDAVTDERFFIALEGDPTRYRIDDDGLTLALGFAVLDDLNAAQRAGRDLADSLQAMLEPVSALDRTADIILAALTIACLDENCPAGVGAAIVGAFADLQNPNANHFPAFAGLVRKRLEPFIQAAQIHCLSSARQPNFDWLEAALQSAKEDDRVWGAMTPYLQYWLSFYSLSPEIRMFPNSGEPKEKVEEKRTNIEKKISKAVAALSEAERQVLNELTRSDKGDLNTLSLFAMTLMAGKPLAPFAVALRNWSFGNALNGSPWAPREEFIHLIRLNCTDWLQAHSAIREASKAFEVPSVSGVGKWALVNLLRATGDPDDAGKADPLVAELTANRPLFSGRLVEDYSAADPCDPSSQRSDDIATTGARYAAIDVTKVRLGMWVSEVDNFLAKARPAIARFDPRVGIHKHRQFIADVLSRDGLPLRHGMLEMRHHNALVTREHAEQLIARVKAGTAGAGLEDRDQWLIIQYHLLLALPMLSADEQIDVLLSGDVGKHILLDLMDVAKPLDMGKYEALLDRAVRDNDEGAQHLILEFGRCTKTPVAEQIHHHLIDLTRSPSERVRAGALGLIAAAGKTELIGAVAKGGWTAADTRRSDGYEAWYGSSVILEAARRGMIAHDEAISRIAPGFYGLAALELGGDTVRQIARRIDISIKAAAGLSLDPVGLDVALEDEVEQSAEPVSYRVDEKEDSSRDPLDSFQRLSESNEALAERQKRARAAFDDFRNGLTQANAQIILDRHRLVEFDAIAASDKQLAESWFDLFMGLPPRRRAMIHNLGLLLAHALSHWSPDKAARMFRELGDSEAIVRVTFERSRLPLQAIAPWSANDHPEMEALCFDRLDAAKSDHELAVEVLAAHWSEKQAQLGKYIDARLNLGHPAFTARALMVAGLSERSAFNDQTLARYKGTPGFIGRARAAAFYAYERNNWARHWFAEMRKTTEPTDFWRYSALFDEIVDGRFDIWKEGGSQSSDVFAKYWSSINNPVKNRMKKWRDKRAKKLFGDNAPPRAFLSNPATR